ncbi:MAG TPA: S41 family peptidase [Caulobacteraceae bacterium]|jgi:C-terminal processing protease CtpA/Prc
MRRLTALLASALLAGALSPLASPVLAQALPTIDKAPDAPTGPMTADEQRATLEDLAQQLQDNFVFPDAADRYAAMLRANAKSGAYANLTDPKAFATKVTADLQAVAKDGHLRMTIAEERGLPADLRSKEAMPKVDTMGLEETKMIGDVAYLRFSLFPEDPKVAAAARDFLIAHQDAKAVIIDARKHHGGGLSVMDAFLPLLYAKETMLVRMDTRASAAGDGPLPFKSLHLQPSPKSVVRADQYVEPDTRYTGLQHVPVYYLTAHYTASAAEHLAFAFKRTHRAILVGETTRGAGHYGGPIPIGKRFAAFIPVGRTYDPDTNLDWEGVGVKPDVDVPADQALDKALDLARLAGAHP